MTIERWIPAVLFAMTTLSTVGCDEDKPKDLAPSASALTSAAPKTVESMKMAVDKDSSQATFLMDAPLEKIHGDVPKSVDGELFVDLNDVTNTTGLVKIDLFQLTLFQQKRDDEKGEYGEKVKDDTQNQHARTWLEISDDAPEDVREKNRYVEFKIKSIANASEKNIASMKGDERKITADVTGDLRLHGRVSEKTAKLEIVFKYAGDKPESVSIKSMEPVVVGLEQHDVAPREAFGKLAKATLGTLGSKVAKEAPVEFEFTAKSAGE